jgi:energy-coupling factor transporter transmembrane protein EcfT
MTTDNEEEKEDAVVDKNRVTLSGRELIILVVFTPVVFTWLFLGARIIISATTSVAVLDSIEGLLTALAVLTIPVSAGIAKLFEGWGNNDGKD